MKVVVSRSGGVAGLSSTWQVVIDDQPDPRAWIILIRELPWDEVEATRPRPDRYVYRIRCQAPEEHVDREATLAEQQVTGPWRELVDRVREASAPASRGGDRTPKDADAAKGGGGV